MLIIAIYPCWVCLGNDICFVFLFLWCPHMHITQLAPFAYRRWQSDWCHRCGQASRQQDETECVCEVLLQPSAAQSPQPHQSGVFRHQVSIVWKWCWTQRCFFLGAEKTLITSMSCAQDVRAGGGSWYCSEDVLGGELLAWWLLLSQALCAEVLLNGHEGQLYRLPYWFWGHICVVPCPVGKFTWWTFDRTTTVNSMSNVHF